MGPLRLAVLGIGSVRCAPPIIGSLAGYFGERELEVRFYDEDAERLDLFDRLARRCFEAEDCGHLVIATTDPEEALEGADLVIMAIGENSARKFLKRSPSPRLRPGAPIDRGTAVMAAVDSILYFVPEDAPMLSLLRDVVLVDDHIHVPIPDWPEALAEADRLAIPFQVLRWIRHEEPVAPLIDLHRHSLIKSWLDAQGPHASRRGSHDR
ncbi:MAG TPA: hypothetical protein PLL78_03885 [Fimbriimonadaceae bacterium]|nr:hypothetical protein [Fimbriimonadaceae bacterium]HRJ95801.1 hypothetical protein [Fimbriimonadaceae bacterium]